METLAPPPSCQLAQELHLSPGLGLHAPHPELLCRCSYCQPCPLDTPWTYAAALSLVPSPSCSLWTQLIAQLRLSLGEGLCHSHLWQPPCPPSGSSPARSAGREGLGGRAKGCHPLPGKEQSGDLSAPVTILTRTRYGWMVRGWCFDKGTMWDTPSRAGTAFQAVRYRGQPAVTGDSGQANATGVPRRVPRSAVRNVVS